MPFPTSPVNGERYTDSDGVTHEYASAKNKWKIVLGSSAKVTIGSVFPVAPTSGEFFYRSDLQTLYLYKSDVWVDTTASAGKLIWESDGSDGYLLKTGVVPSEAIRVDASQKVLIGKSAADGGVTPGFEWDPAFDLGYFTSASNNALLLRRNSDGAVMSIINSAGTTTGQLAISGTGVILNGAAGETILETGGTEAMRIDSSQNVLMGKASAGVANVGVEWNNSTGRLFLTNDQSTRECVLLNHTDGGLSTRMQTSRATRPGNSAYSFLVTESNAGSDIEHNLRGDGNAFCDGSWTGGGADRAEFMEWDDGNISNEDRRGFTVVNIGNQKIRQATQADKDAGTKIFAISSNPDSVGNAAPFKWKDKHLRDQFGSYDLDVNGDRQPNPDFLDQPYMSREDRKEWSAMAMSGITRVRTNQIIPDEWIEQSTINADVKEYLVF